MDNGAVSRGPPREDLMRLKIVELGTFEGRKRGSDYVPEERNGAEKGAGDRLMT
jgi:hypothetical protein